MTVVAASVVDWEALGEMVAVSFAAGLAVTAAYAIAIFGLTRLSEQRRAGRTAAATAYMWLGGTGLAFGIGAVVLGIAVMASN
jgi:hypothetical protein